VIKPLDDLGPGKTAVVVSLRGGRDFRGRLRRLGLAEGQRIQKISGIALGGPVIIVVNRSQIAIGRGMARRIIVNEAHAHDKGRRV
jgi:ferrous iron transport protein A